MPPEVRQQRSRAARVPLALATTGLPLANYKVVTETKSAALSCTYLVGKLLRNPQKR